ncbi:MAG TPA: copper chaperone PCu(A)C [Streptosporangiaceae bacterium]|jgi:hypothetical protein
MTATPATRDATAIPPDGRPPARSGRAWRRDLIRSAAAPATCAAVLTGLLSAWVLAGGAGTISRVRIQVTLAAIPMTSFTARDSPGRAAAYLTIRNLSGVPDDLTGASSPAARQVTLSRSSAGPAAGSLVIPARGTVTLTPFGRDLVLAGASGLRAGQRVPLILNFRRAGRITILATVTAPGAP